MCNQNILTIILTNILTMCPLWCIQGASEIVALIISCEDTHKTEQT